MDGQIGADRQLIAVGKRFILYEYEHESILVFTSYISC